VVEGITFKAQGRSFLTTPYQEGKIEKHTVGDPTAPVNSTLSNVDRAVYEKELGHALDAGSLQINSRGRQNVFHAANAITGSMVRASGTTMTSGVMLVLPDDPFRAHGFAYGNDDIPNRECTKCGAQIPW
jgi:hypothetical protein